MGNGSQCHTLQDCIQIQIQSQPRNVFHRQVPLNPHHSRRKTRLQENEVARGIGVHSQSGDEKAKKIIAATTGATVQLGQL